MIFSGNEVKGLQKTMWFRDDVQDIKLDKVEFNMSKEKLSNNSDTIYNTVGVESKPEYPGGIGEFLSFIGKNYKSPNDKNFKGGKVIVSFVVEKDGSLADIKVLKEAGYETGKEAIRVLKLCEKWKPATQLGLPVRCSYMLPINLVAN